MAKGIYVGVSDIKLICPRSACRSTRITRIHTNPDKYQCGDCLFEGTLEQFKEGKENTARKVRKSYFGVGGRPGKSNGDTLESAASRGRFGTEKKRW